MLKFSAHFWNRIAEVTIFNHLIKLFIHFLHMLRRIWFYLVLQQFQLPSRWIGLYHNISSSFNLTHTSFGIQLLFNWGISPWITPSCSINLCCFDPLQLFAWILLLKIKRVLQELLQLRFRVRIYVFLALSVIWVCRTPLWSIYIY